MPVGVQPSRLYIHYLEYRQNLQFSYIIKRVGKQICICCPSLWGCSLGTFSGESPLTRLRDAVYPEGRQACRIANLGVPLRLPTTFCLAVRVLFGDDCACKLWILLTEFGACKPLWKCWRWNSAKHTSDF